MNTPKEKAGELFDEMWHEIANHNLEMTDIDFIAKQCALIAVEEIISMGIMSDSGDWKMAKSYWNEVKQEIENL